MSQFKGQVVADWLYNEGWKRVPYLREIVVPHSEGRVTQHGSVVVRLSVRDRVAVGGGRMYTAWGSKIQLRSLLKGIRRPMHRVQCPSDTFTHYTALQ